MSYINTKILESRNITPIELFIIQMCKQARIEDISTSISPYNHIVELLIKKELIAPIKGKKGETLYQTLRTTKSGLELLDLISTPVVTDGDEQMYKYLCDMYLEEDSTRSLGNRKAGLRYCAEFRQILGITLHEMYYLCEMFVANTTFSKVLEYIFFEKKHNPYGKFKDNLDSSKLYLFWMDNEYEIREYWAQKIKTE